MADINVRQARLDDTVAICALFRAGISAWQRLDEHGRVEDVPYEALTVYERWLHGGAWMSIETAAVHLTRLLLGAGIALVGEADGQIAGYAEAYHSIESEPFGSNLNPAHIVTNHHVIDDALLDALKVQAQTLRCQRLTALATDMTLYKRHGMTPLERVMRYNVPARTGQIFYRANEHPDADAAQISGMRLTVGHVMSARQAWETLWHNTWDVLPEIRQRHAYRLRFTAAGHDAFIFAQPQLYNPRALDIYAWSQKPLSTQLLAALRDWAHKEGFRTLVMALTEDTAKILPPEAEPDGYNVEFYGIEM